MVRKIEIQPWFLTASCLVGLFVMIACLIGPNEAAYTTSQAPPDGSKVEIDLPLPKRTGPAEINITYGEWWHRAVIILNGHNSPDTIEKLVAGEPIRKWNGYLLWDEGGMPHSVGSTELSEFKADQGTSPDMHAFHPLSMEVCYLDLKGHMTHWRSPLVPGTASAGRT